jgi:hypothetical protein
MSSFQRRILSSLILVHLIGQGQEAKALNRREARDLSGTGLQSAGKASRPEAIVFKPVLAGEMTDPDGTHFSITDYKAPDGVVLAVKHNEFPSDVAAREYFNRAIGKVTKIIERGAKKDRAGKIVGERAEFIAPMDRFSETVSGVLLTFGSHFYQITSSSVLDNRKLEKQLTN